jgi:hypothetical protein|tara:strand:+ start:198 stop:380 length:183 start_codon:yes stop_codon:yes gene_type:complete
MSNEHNIAQEEYILDEVYNDNSTEMQLMVTNIMLSFKVDRDMALMKITEERIEEWRKAHG